MTDFPAPAALMLQPYAQKPSPDEMSVEGDSEHTRESLYMRVLIGNALLTAVLVVVVQVVVRHVLKGGEGGGRPQISAGTLGVLGIVGLILYCLSDIFSRLVSVEETFALPPQDSEKPIERAAITEPIGTMPPATQIPTADELMHLVSDESATVAREDGVTEQNGLAYRQIANEHVQESVEQQSVNDIVALTVRSTSEIPNDDILF